MSFLKAVTQTLGKMVRLFTQPSTQDQELRLLNANKQPVKSGQPLQDVATPVRKKRKPKASVAPSTKAEALPKAAKKSAPVKRGQAGKQSKITASKTPQRAKRVSKAKA